MAPLGLSSHSCPSPISTSGSERTQLLRTPDLTDLCSNSSSSQSFLSPYLASDDNVSSLSLHVMLITHIWISEVFGHHSNGLLISNGTTLSTTEIRTLQWQPHSSSHFCLISTTLCRTPGLQRRSITCPSPCAQANPCSKGCSVTSPTRLIGFKSKCLLRFHWAIRGQIWHPLLLSLSHFSADILEVLGEFQVVTCNLAVRSQGLLSADKAATSQGKADSCRSKEPLKPLFNHLILLLAPLNFLFFFCGGDDGEGRERKCKAILSAPGLPGFPKFAASVQNLLLHQLLQSAVALWNGAKIDFHTDPSEGIYCLSTADPELHVLAEQCTHCLFLSSPKINKT